jgi:putative ubiquitin-RnfH superfamily antitoxin RatB of RatAB toxin-antitoxin module
MLSSGAPGPRPGRAVDAVRVEVVYALPAQQTRLEIEIPPGTTLRGAVVRSGILSMHPEIDLARNGVSVYGERRRLDAFAEEGDRIEIGRALVADPKTARRRRADKGR